MFDYDNKNLKNVDLLLSYALKLTQKNILARLIICNDNKLNEINKENHI